MEKARRGGGISVFSRSVAPAATRSPVQLPLKDSRCRWPAGDNQLFLFVRSERRVFGGRFVRRAIAAAARAAGLLVRPISPHYQEAPRRHGLMLGFSGFPRQLIIPAAARLGALVAGWDMRMKRGPGRR